MSAATISHLLKNIVGFLPTLAIFTGSVRFAAQIGVGLVDGWTRKMGNVKIDYVQWGSFQLSDILIFVYYLFVWLWIIFSYSSCTIAILNHTGLDCLYCKITYKHVLLACLYFAYNNWGMFGCAGMMGVVTCLTLNLTTLTMYGIGSWVVRRYELKGCVRKSVTWSCTRIWQKRRSRKVCRVTVFYNPVTVTRVSLV